MNPNRFVVSAAAVLVLAAFVCVGTLTVSDATAADPPAAADKEQAAPPKEIETLAQNWASALEEGHVERMKPMIAPGYVYVNPRGKAIDGESMLRQFKDRSIKFKVVPKDSSFRLHKDAVVMTGVCQIAGTVDGAKVDGDYRYVDVFQRKDDRWLAIASTLTLISEAP